MNRSFIPALVAYAALGGGSFRSSSYPAPPKYAGQSQAFRQGAWAGDGVNGPTTRQMRRNPIRSEGGRL